VRDPELKYGLSVTGLVEIENLRQKSLARPGDVLVLTKPLGTGLVGSAIKGGKLAEDSPLVVAALASMEALNAAASEIFTKHGVKAATDVTGFGLVGHALSFAQGSGVGFEIEVGKLPLLPGVLDFARKPLGGGSKANEEAAAAHVDRASGLDEVRARLAFDAQTSGGLLGAVAPDKVEALVADLEAAGSPAHAVIGRVTAEGVGRVRLV